jgi:hypothetical protein
MDEIETKPIVIALVINLALIFILPKLFSKPTGFKAFDDFVSYLKAQQAFLGFSTVLLALVMYGAAYYMKHYDQAQHSSYRGELLTEDFATPHVPKSVSPE